jgi:hypothetical protein
VAAAGLPQASAGDADGARVGRGLSPVSCAMPGGCLRGGSARGCADLVDLALGRVIGGLWVGLGLAGGVVASSPLLIFAI